MAVMEIKTAGAPVLKQIASPVTKIDKRIKKLLDDMAETMYATSGIGIAAPQVGISLRLIVVDVEGKRFDMINPEIISSAGNNVDVEGCLSCPNLFGEVVRADSIQVKYQTRYHKTKTIDAQGLFARCIQHEIDHLNGKLFIDIARNIQHGQRQAN